MTQTQQFLTIAILAAGVILTRFLPFLLFPPKKATPPYVQYLGTVLPAAVFGMLVVYCIKDVDFLSPTYGIPELLCIALTVVLHIWKRQMLISIAGGTLAYMLIMALL